MRTGFFFDDATKTFMQGNEPLVVLDSCTATFEPGNSYAITGASGSGKSTLIHLLAGLDEPTKGAVYFDKFNLATIPPEQLAGILNTAIGCVFQDALLVPELSVIENVMLKGMIAGEDPMAGISHALELLDRVGLQDKAYEHPRALSGGQQQRVAVLRAIYNKPQFILADEPTGNLDQETGRIVIDLLKEYQSQTGAGLIIASHDEYVSQEMQQVLRLHNGNLA